MQTPNTQSPTLGFVHSLVQASLKRRSTGSDTGSDSGPVDLHDRSAWTAWQDMLPTGPSILHVLGECRLESGSCQARLKRSRGHASDPATVYLELEVTGANDGGSAAPSTVEVRYWEETASLCRFVVVLPDRITLPVEEVF